MAAQDNLGCILKEPTTDEKWENAQVELDKASNHLTLAKEKLTRLLEHDD